MERVPFRGPVQGCVDMKWLFEGLTWRGKLHQVNIHNDNALPFKFILS